MLALIATLILLLLPVTALAYRLKRPMLIGSWLAVFVLFLFFHVLPIWVVALATVTFIALMGFFYASHIRQDKIAAPLMSWFQKQLPSLTPAEREALTAGGLWWEAKLFTANPAWNELTQLPPLQLTAEEQAFLDNETEQLCRMLNDWQIVNELADLPESVWQFIRKNGFLSFIIDKKYGGKGFSAYAHSCIVSKIASRSMSAAVNIMVPNSLGPAEFLLHFGTEEQKNYYLPRLAAGDEIPCFGLTAPDAGSDASAITDVGVVCKGHYQGEEVIGVRLNFNKRYITLAPIATLMGIAFKLYDPDYLIGKKESIGITFALLPTHFPGVEIGQRHWPSQLAFMNGPIRGQDVFVPMSFMLGGEAYYGKGWEMMMECLAVGRGISLPALATAGCQFSARMTANYAQIRRQFNQSIGDFEGIGLLLGKMAGFAFMAEATRCFTLRAIDGGIRPSIATAITKYHLTEMSRQSVLAAMDIHGGRAVQAGPHNYLHLLYNAAPTAITVEGANILTRNLIIFGQGAMRCHPFIADEILAAKAEDTATFDSLLLQHLGYANYLWAYTFFHGLTGEFFLKLPGQPPYQRQLKSLQRLSAAFALLSECAFVTLGKQLKAKEALSARLGDALSFLYMSAAMVAYASEKKSDLALVEWGLQYGIEQIQWALQAVLDNFPKRWLAWLLQRIIFPWGKKSQAPQDSLTLHLAEQLQTDPDFRQRLSPFLYRPAADDPVGQVEAAWAAWRQVQPILNKMQLAMQKGVLSRQKSLLKSILEAAEKAVISAQEKQQWDGALAQVWQAIQVDEFDNDAMPVKAVQFGLKEKKSAGPVNQER